MEKDGIFIAEGPRVVKALSKTNIEAISSLATEYSYKKYRPYLLKLVKRGAPVYISDNDTIEDVIGFRFHQGLMVAARSPKKLPFSMIAGEQRSARLLVALDRVNDPQNVGLVVRNAAAFGADALIVDPGSYDPYYRKAVRVSVGSIFNLPVAYETEIAPFLKRLKKDYDTRIIVTSPGHGATDIKKTDLSGNVCFVFGNEDTGVSDKVLKLADRIVKVPISRNVDSLNVACTSAICLHEAAEARS
ncbi:MAG: RNA methyltransferase [Candidatus Omnitrophota bacterium]|jgi:TrmH family RNA methyltransferase